MRPFRGYLLILGATLFWGVSATLARFLISGTIDTLILVQTRMTISWFLLVAFFLAFNRNILRVHRRDLFQLALLGIIGGAGSNFTYYFTIKETNVATAILLQYLAPLLVLGYSAWTKEEDLTPWKAIAGIGSIAGCFLAVTGRNFSFESLSSVGLLTGLGSAFCWGFANIMIRRMLHRYSVWTTLVYSFSFASLFWVVINPPWVIAGLGYTASTWWMLVVFAVISILIPHSLYYSGVQYLTASRAIITATFEPFMAIGSAFLFLGETLAPVQLLGAVLVIAAIMVLQLKEEAGQPLQPDPLP